MQHTNQNADNNSELKLSIEKVNRRIRRDRIILNNPVIMQGIGLAPLIVAANSSFNALVLCVAVICILTPTRIVAAMLSHIIPVRFKGVIYVIVSAFMYIPAYYVISYFFTTAQISQVGLYLPLLVIDPIIIKRYEAISNENFGKSLSKGLITTTGYVLVLFIIGCLREIIGAGTFFGVVLFKTAPMPIALLPAGGFIILALLMMVWRSSVNVIKQSLISAQEEHLT